MMPAVAAPTPRFRRLTAAAVGALIVAGCGGAELAANEPLAVVATTTIWSDVVANVACEGQALVESVIPAGADPHAFEASLADRGRLEEAALVVANGRGLEEGLEDVLDAVAAAGTPVLFVADEVPGGGADPHVWFDPDAVAAALPALAAGLVGAGLDRDAVDGCLRSYQEELTALDAEIEQILAPVPPERRRLVTNHDSLGAFADRYGFEVLGTVIPSSSTLAEPNPAQLEALAQRIEAAQVPAIFAESQDSTDDATALADRLGGVEVVVLTTGTLGEPGSGADTYVGLLRTTATRIADALGPD